MVNFNKDSKFLLIYFIIVKIDSKSKTLKNLVARLILLVFATASTNLISQKESLLQNISIEDLLINIEDYFQVIELTSETFIETTNSRI